MTKFTKHRNHTKKRLGTSWRRPRGWQNKMRLSKKGHRPKVRVGYRTQADLRGKKNGLEVVTVYNVADVKALDAKTQGAVVGAIGKKKKIEVLKAIQDNNIALLTGDAKAQQQALEQAFADRKKLSEARDKEREEKQKALEEKAKEAEKEQQAEEQEDPDEKKQAEEDQKEKVLTKAR